MIMLVVINDMETIMQLLKSFKKRDVFAYDVYADQECNAYNYESFVREGFIKNVVVYRAISLISQCVGSVEFIVSDDSRNFDALESFLQFPNKSQSMQQLLEAVTSYLLLSGNAFMYMSCDAGTLSMQALRPDRVEIIPSKVQSSVECYVYSVNGRNVKITDTDNMIHVRFFNPINDWYGLSPLQPTASSIDQHNAVSTHNLSILRNGGRPSGCLMVKNGSDGLTDQQREQLRQGLKDSYSGTKNAGKIMILEGDFDWKEIGKTPKELDFFSGKNVSAREIAQAFGIPPMLIGIQGDSMFANYREARFHLWEDTILPIVNKFVDGLNKWIHNVIDKNVTISVNLDKIPALSYKRDNLWKRISNCDFLTVEEKREMLGLSSSSN